MLRSRGLQEDRLLLKLIACEVFARELCHCAALSPHTIDFAFTEKAAHDRSPVLRQTIQQMIDETDRAARPYDAILLGFGLCGNSVSGIRAGRLSLVVPRAHDCCTLFLGSRKRFEENFADNPSRPFSSAGYLERGAGDGYLRESTLAQTLGTDKTYEQYVELYGEENAAYIMETIGAASGADHSDTVVFIDVPETSHLGFAEKCRLQAEADGKTFTCLAGDIRLFRKLTSGEWDEEEFLVVQPGQKIEPCYDWDRVIRAVPADDAAGTS